MSTRLNIFRHERVKNRPIWFMRQAGRYLPEYMAVRKSVKNFLELCYDVEKATEVTLQPIRRYGFDAAIIFSDILVLPDVLGWDVQFQAGIGPVLKQFRTEDDFADLQNDLSKASKIYDIIANIRKKLDSNVELIGFAGSPWTVAIYMLEGRGKTDFAVAKQFAYQETDLTDKLIELLTIKTIEHLKAQIKAGASIIQLFDSWSGLLNGEFYERYVISPTVRIVEALKKEFSNIPIIGFPKGSGYNYDQYIAKTGLDGVSVDQFTPLKQMRRWQKEITVQGNFDPILLLTDKGLIAKEAAKILYELDGENFIFNLGHGVTPATPVDNVKFLVDYVRNYKR